MTQSRERKLVTWCDKIIAGKLSASGYTSEQWASLHQPAKKLLTVIAALMF